jgi:hypothetical protein
VKFCSPKFDGEIEALTVNWMDEMLDGMMEGALAKMERAPEIE